ncbi:MerR family transcriptional regulator [Clostridium sp.]|uniref:MerR family transcriptional regulator n=1 Tax=Clostridium sp. TaxID=1506 RepID=UPI0028523CA9|nr:MerR family transcriptional regulator [Clostridium sp.]MDR3595638.1 MerR family transcriptional regulator [Clostridium sp.]
MKTVNEVSKIAGVSVSTLHYYDEINLLKPTKITDTGYRLYTNDDLVILQQILLFKEIGIPLAGIKKILEDSDYDKQRVLECQKRLLCIKRNRLNSLINQITNMSKDDTMLDFNFMNSGETEWELIWEEIYHRQGEVQHEVLKTVEEAVKYFKENRVKRVLDLGCGMGRHSLYLLQQGFDVTACDISRKGLEVTKKKASKAGFKIDITCCDMRELPFKDNMFDAILCVWVSGHGNLQDMKKHASEMLRVVKSNGIIFVDYPSKEDERYGIGIEIEENTFLENMPGEEKIPHYYCDENEIEDTYKEHNTNINPYTYSFYDKQNNEHHIKAYVCFIQKSI